MYLVNSVGSHATGSNAIQLFVLIQLILLHWWWTKIANYGIAFEKACYLPLLHSFKNLWNMCFEMLEDDSTVILASPLQYHTGNVHEQVSGFWKTSRIQQGLILFLALNFLQRLVLSFPESDHFKYVCHSLP